MPSLPAWRRPSPPWVRAEPVEAVTDLAHGLDQVGLCVFRRAINARVDGLAREIVELPHRDGQALRPGKASDAVPWLDRGGVWRA